MRALVLKDETWTALESVLEQSEDGRAVLARLFDRPKLPADRELLRLARTDETPEAFTRAREVREYLDVAADEARRQMDRLIRHARGGGVPVSALARWSGLSGRRVRQITDS